MDHRAVRELAAGAALDDLDAAEQAALDAHRAGCRPCRDEAAGLADTAGWLALAAPVRRPPAGLLDAVLDAIAAPPLRAAAATPPFAAPMIPASSSRATAPRIAAGEAAPATLDALRRERTWWRRVAMAGLAAAAVLAVAVVGLGSVNGGLRDDLDAVARDRDGVAALAATAAAERDALAARLASSSGALSTMIAPDHATAALTPDALAAGASISVVYRPGTTDAWLMAGDLPAAPAGKVYQLWWADENGAHALATFTCTASGPCIAPFGVDLGAASATMITLEPAGGAAGDPGPQVAFGELQG